MNFEIYCDESGLEALSNKSAHLFTGIGGIWIPSAYREKLKAQLKDIKSNHAVFGEFKWNKVSPAYLEFYREIINYFFSKSWIRFRVVLIESSKVDNVRFHGSDNELSFYKFYYQLIKHWILDFNEYEIFLDYKLNRNKGRLNELKNVLNNANLTSVIKNVQGLPSEQSLGIQLADLLTGLTTAKFNGELSGKAKKELIQTVENHHLNHQIQPTGRNEDKFNVFRINLSGGW